MIRFHSITAANVARVTGWLLLPMLLLALTGARAEYPERPITGVVPFGTGGPSDLISRLVATAMSKELGQSIVILNKPGGGGNVGMDFVVKSKPDGYTLLFCSIATTQNPAVYRKMPYDPLKDMVAVGMFAETAALLAVSTAKVSAKTLAEFIDVVRKNPGKFNIAGGGGIRMTQEKFMQHFGVKMEIVGFRSAGDAATALMSGEVEFMPGNATTLAPGIKSGRVRILAVSGDNRVKAFPDVPTAKEAGFPGYTDSTYIGLYAPSGVPAEILNKLNDVVRRAVVTPEVQQRLLSLDYTALHLNQQQADAFYKSEVLRWKEVAKKGNIEPMDE